MSNKLSRMKSPAKLESFIASHLPLVTAMQASINFYDGKTFRLQAPLAVNHNDKGTAFGGSLYNLCITNAIGLGFLKSYEQGLEPNLVVAKADVEYRAPVTDAILIAHCNSPTKTQWATFFNEFRERGRAKIAITSTVYQGDNIACQFNGLFAIIGASDV